MLPPLFRRNLWFQIFWPNLASNAQTSAVVKVKTVAVPTYNEIFFLLKSL